MRFERWRGAFFRAAWHTAIGLGLGVCLSLGLGLACPTTARADGYRFHYTIPRVVDAYDYTTGGQYQAPPIPYGHYAKDPMGYLSKIAGCAGCQMHAMLGCLGCGHEHGHGLGHGDGCGLFGCGGHGNGHGLGSGLFHHGGGGPCVVPGCGGGAGCGHRASAGRFAPIDGGVIADPISVTAQRPAVVAPSPQDPCGVPGCQVAGRHSHGRGLGGVCGLCGGRGCGACLGDPNGGGHGHGLGLGHGNGHGLGHGSGHGCPFCGGRGCANCLSKLAGLHGRLAGLHGRLLGALNHQKVDYFVGPGGPVPITPGYVPYIVSTRSPRDFFSFAPMNPNDR